MPDRPQGLNAAWRPRSLACSPAHPACTVWRSRAPSLYLSLSFSISLSLSAMDSRAEHRRSLFLVPPRSPPATATISASSPPPHARSAVSQGCRCSRQRYHQQGRRGHRWRTWLGGCGPLLAGPRPGASEARRRQASARVPRRSIATPPPPTSSLRPKPRASDGLLCFDSRGGLHATIRIKEGSYLQCYRLI